MAKPTRGGQTSRPKFKGSRLPQFDWIAEAESLQNETLVFLIRQTGSGDQEPFGDGILRHMGD